MSGVISSTIISSHNVEYCVWTIIFFKWACVISIWSGYEPLQGLVTYFLKATVSALNSVIITKTKTKLHGLSPRANYTDRATVACRRSDCQLLRIEGATWLAWRIPTAVFSVSRQEPLLFYQVAPQLSHEADWPPFQTDYFFFSGSAGNRSRASGSVAKNSDH
jgi:hypothetical protein